MNYIKTFSLVLLLSVSCAQVFGADHTNNNEEDVIDLKHLLEEVDQALTSSNWRSRLGTVTSPVQNHPVITAGTAVAAAAVAAYAGNQTVRDAVNNTVSTGYEFAKEGVNYVASNATKTQVATAIGGTAVLTGVAAAGTYMYKDGITPTALAQGIKSTKTYKRTSELASSSMTKATDLASATKVRTLQLVDAAKDTRVGTFVDAHKGAIAKTGLFAAVLAAAAVGGKKLYDYLNTPESVQDLQKEFIASLTPEQKKTLKSKYGSTVTFRNIIEDEEFYTALSQDQATIAQILLERLSLENGNASSSAN